MRNWLLVLLSLLVAFPMYAGGRKANESHQSSNPSGFSESIDIREKKKGKWNVYFEAQDKGGNAGIVGPYNLFIDPESDLPVTRIINPYPSMHVAGNLNIVGTCTDDDGVDYVELIITKGGDGKGELMLHARAVGADFWSYFLDTSDTEKWKDGLYTITAWGVDIHGLSGVSDTFPAKAHRKHQISWHLDRKRPEITVTSHDLGALVNGRVTLSGHVWDGNGIDQFSYSLDNGRTYQYLKLNYDRRHDRYSFSLPIDTRTFEDGPEIIWFRARDGMGTVGTLEFLVFVTNTAPKIQILYPTPNETVSNIFSVAGYPDHLVGLESLSWKLGKESGEIPLIVGNPWWVQEFDIRGQNVKSLDLEIRAVDHSGNVTVEKRKILVDQAAGAPKITVNSPTAGAVIYNGRLLIEGLATDNNGVEAILYSLDGTTPVEINSSGYFHLAVDNVPVGVNTLEVWARNTMGVESSKVVLRGIVSAAKAPEVKISQVRSGRAATASNYYSGMAISPDVTGIDIQVASRNDLKYLTVQFGSLEPSLVSVRRARGADLVQTVAIPANIESGLVRVQIAATDIYEQETVRNEYVIVQPRGGRDTGTTFAWVHQDASLGDGRILLSTGEALVGVFNGGQIQSAQISGSAPGLVVSVDSLGRMNLQGTADGSYGPVRFILSPLSGQTFTSPEYRFLVDSSNPELSLVNNPDGAWVQNSIPFSFMASDSNRITAVEYNINLGNNWVPLIQPSEIASANFAAPFDYMLNISSFPDGAINIALRVTDEADKQSTASFMVIKDTIAPEASLVVPIPGARVNGSIRMGIAVKDAGKIASVRYENPITGISKQVYDASQESSGRPLTFLNVVLDAKEMPLSMDMTFVFTDAAGNSTVFSGGSSGWPFIIDEEMDLPVTEISMPFEDEVITSDFIISGICFDDDAISHIYWRIDDGSEQALRVNYGFSIPVPLSSLTDNEHTITIYAEDIYGVRGHPVTRRFRVSLEEPKGYITAPLIGEVIGGTITVTGVASDNNGIGRVQVSLDNGNTYNDADGGSDWTYTFNSSVLEDGPHVILVRMTDNYGISSVYSSMLVIDNIAPELIVNSPLDGAVTAGSLFVAGQARDNIMLDSIKITFSSLEGVNIPTELAERQVRLDNIILEELDLRALPNGLYNVEIWAIDRANNASRASRNIELAKEADRNFVDILYPLNGEHVMSRFNLYGVTGGIDTADRVSLYIGGRVAKVEPVSETGYFRFSLTDEDLEEGWNSIFIRSDFSGMEQVQSTERLISYSPTGPWVTVDTLNMGDFAYERPWLMGYAGYALSEEDQEILADKKADKELKSHVQAKKLSKVELSFDNGRSFHEARKGHPQYDWRYRLQTQDMPEGIHYLILRATMANNETAVTRFLVQVDKTPPVIRVISPHEGGHFNEEMQFTALASDDQGLASLSYHLRKGDKSAYEIPAFIKGLYFDFVIPPFIKYIWNDAPWIFNGGATFFDIGFGLSFFDENVKLQVSYGQMTQGEYEALGGKGPLRYGGHVLGIKLLANVYTLPFSTIGGPDWDWLFASFALGANFSFFDLAQQGYTQSGKSTWLTAMVAQIEFPKVTIPKRSYIRTFSFFTEGQLWFVPTDLNADAHNLSTVVPHVVAGIRMYMF